MVAVDTGGNAPCNVASEEVSYSEYAVSSTGEGAFYASAASGLGAGTTWDTYTATLTSTQPYTLTLHAVSVTVNDTDVYTGDFTLVVTGTTYLEGSGHTAAPNFADCRGSGHLSQRGVSINIPQK